MPKIAIITGASTGIGKSLGGALVARGDNVILVARTQADVQRAADELTARGPGKAWAAALDVRDSSAVAECVESVYRDHGRLDLMVNNAGIAAGGLVEEMTLAYWDALYETNVRGVLNGIYAAYPIMIKQGFGQIANTASIAGLLPAPFEAPYSMSKFAIVGLTLALRLEAERNGVRVNVICPGLVETPLFDKGNPPGLPPVMHNITDLRTLLRHGLRTGICDPDRFASDVLRDLDKNRPIIVRPAAARWLWLSFRMSPRLSLAYGRRYVSWGIKQLGAAPMNPPEQHEPAATNSRAGVAGQPSRHAAE